MYRVKVRNRHHKRDGEHIGRPSPLGNPFTVESYGRDTCIDMYEYYFFDKIRENDLRIIKELLRLHDIGKRTGIVGLLCSCAPRRCHGDIIKKFLLENFDLLEEWMEEYVEV